MTERCDGRSDLVIGITLAEVFLLLLIVGWYGSRLESESPVGPEGPAGTVPRATFDDVVRREKDAQEALQKERDKYRQLERILEWIAKTAGIPGTIRDLDDAKKALDKVQHDAKRGRPACQEQNILVDVVAADGSVEVRLRQSFAFGAARYQEGQVLRSGDEVRHLLQFIDDFYTTQRLAKQSDCVFDYSLTWITDLDYRSAREVFERYFYPAGVRQKR